MTNTVKRITKAMRFSDIKAILNGDVPEYGTTKNEAIEFIDKELALLAKKNTGEKKPTAKQLENEVYKERILGFLMTQVEPVTCSDIQEGIPELRDFRNQKVAALVKPLVDTNKVTRTVVKGRSMFTIA